MRSMLNPVLSTHVKETLIQIREAIPYASPEEKRRLVRSQVTIMALVNEVQKHEELLSKFVSPYQ